MGRIKTSAKIYRHIINKFGIEVIVKRRSKVWIDEETSEWVWDEGRAIKAEVTQLTGYKELAERLGIYTDADFIMNTYPETEIDVGDQVKIPDEDEWCEVSEVVKRKTAGVIETKEVLLRKIA